MLKKGETVQLPASDAFPRKVGDEIDIADGTDKITNTGKITKLVKTGPKLVGIIVEITA